MERYKYYVRVTEPYEKYNLARLFIGPLRNEESCKNWIRDLELVPTTIKCPECQRRLEFRDCGRWGIFHCHKVVNHKSASPMRISTVAGTFFAHTSLSPIKIMAILYCFARGFSIQMASHEISFDNSISPKTILEWYRIARDAIVMYMDVLYEAPKTLGGEGKAVEVKVFKVFHRQFNKGRFRPGDYMVAILEQGQDGGFKLEHAAIQPFETLTRLTDVLSADSERRVINLLSRHLAKGTEILVDTFLGYYAIESTSTTSSVRKTRFTNETSLQQFYTWLNQCSKHTDLKNDPHLPQRMCEYFWRRHMKINGLDEFNELLRAVRLINANRAKLPDIEFVASDDLQEEQSSSLKIKEEEIVLDIKEEPTVVS